jgi:hypothetical protein
MGHGDKFGSPAQQFGVFFEDEFATIIDRDNANDRARLLGQ